MSERPFCQNPSPVLMAALMAPCGIGMLVLAAGAAHDYAVVGILFAILGAGLILAAPYAFFFQRRYYLDNDVLIARNRLGEVRIPLSDIEEIRIPNALVQRRGGVALVFQARTKLGKQLKILPLYWVSQEEAAGRPARDVLVLMGTAPNERSG